MKTNLRIGIAVALTAAATISLPGMAGQVGNLVTFTAGTAAKSSEVNGNFTAVKTAVDDNQAQITALNARIAALEAKLTNITALNNYLSLETVNGHATVRVSAANLQVVNGAGSTDKINGLGNLVVGYDELRPDTATSSCSISTANSISDRNACVSPAVWAVNHKSGSHNLIVGRTNNYSSYGGVVFGESNAIVDAFANVAGGRGNVAAGPIASVTGGQLNGAWGLMSSVTGGSSNDAYGAYSSVSGGDGGNAYGESSTISGGRFNYSTGPYSAINGGRSNFASGESSTASGGSANNASGSLSAVSGGSQGTASGIGSQVSGGFGNRAVGDGSTVSGGSNRNAANPENWVGGSYSSPN